MKFFALIFLVGVILIPGPAFAGKGVNYSDEEILQAIWQVEGKEKAAPYYYGVRSVKCRSKGACREVCRRTIRNNRVRYAKTKSNSGDFINFLARKFAPIGVANDPRGLNRNWERNMRMILAKNRRTKKNGIISVPQQRRLYAIAKGSGIQDLGHWLKANYKIEKSSEILRSQYEEICKAAKGYKSWFFSIIR